jgi:peroxiredoxin (alkyl hydroperoxide reductase subunit C)
MEMQQDTVVAKVGAPAPTFTMDSTRNLETLDVPVSLDEYRGKWLIMFFYPLDFTFVCPTEITALSDHYDDFLNLGADIIGVSTDSVFSHKAWLDTPREKGGIAGTRYPLASDLTKTVSHQYGVLVEDKGYALRGLFIIDPDGILQYMVIQNENTGRSVGETLRVLQALQTGGLCGANWEPGEKNL